jgi:hypothetical protein
MSDATVEFGLISMGSFRSNNKRSGCLEATWLMLFVFVSIHCNDAMTMTLISAIKIKA